SYCSTMTLMTQHKFILGVGHGQDRLADCAGVPRSTRPLIGRYIEILKRLWNGEIVNAASDNWTLKNAALGLKLLAPPPIFMAATGDKSLAWAGRHCDGVLLFSCLNPSAVAHSVRVIRQAAEGAGRDPHAITICAVAVTACEVSEEKMLNYVVRRLNTYFMLPSIDGLIRVNGWDPAIAASIKAAVFEQARAAQGAVGDEGVSRELDQLRRFRDLYPRAWLEDCHAIGDAATCLRYVCALRNAGADRVIFHGSPPRDLKPLLELAAANP
ncbi:MAG: LLM class flavin-dependent oxidoreductase, partial [Gammaproteobacteria bacterium]